MQKTNDTYLSFKHVLALLLVYLLYAFEPIAAEITSHKDMLSWQFWLGLCTVIGILGLYAICWQQILKHINLSVAYMFKGTSLIFVLMLSYILMGEQITLWNIIGSIVIIIGLIVFAKE